MAKELAATGKAPEHIVVGIPKIDEDHRFKDLTFTGSAFNSSGEPDERMAQYFNEYFTGGGEKFLKHLKEEVVPFVEDKHLVNGFDVYIGHSLSGYYGAYLISMDTPFNAFQIYDPSIWYNQGEVIKHTKNVVENGLKTNVFISTAAGGEDKSEYNVKTHKQFHELLISLEINSKLNVYPDEDHGSVRMLSLKDGLSNLYEGFNIEYIFPTDTITVADAEKHYADFSEKVNFTFTCPPDAYRWVGFANHSQGKWGEALKAYEACHDAFATDAIICTEMAECYENLKDYSKSFKVYKMALELQANDENLQAKVKELEALIVE